MGLAFFSFAVGLQVPLARHALPTADRCVVSMQSFGGPGPGITEFDASKGTMLAQMVEKLKEPMGGMAVYEFKPCLEEAFGKVDGDADGEITKEELGQLLLEFGDELPEEQVDSLFGAVDTNADGLISYVQYYKLMVDEAADRRDAALGKSKGSGGGGGFFGGLFGND